MTTFAGLAAVSLVKAASYSLRSVGLSMGCVDAVELSPRLQPATSAMMQITNCVEIFTSIFLKQRRAEIAFAEARQHHDDHIPGAKNIPWAKAVNEDGTFKSPDELRKIYESSGVDFGKPTIAYCRIGERSSHTWFVLKYLLGQDNVKNYDGSWTEWGNLVGVPIEKGEGGQSAQANVKCQ